MTNRVALSVVERFAFAGGYEFGTVGAYERLVGRAHFAVDPAGAAQRGITDLDKAPTDGDGLAHFTGDFSILKPADPARGNCRLFFDYGNRGNKRMLQFFNDAPASNDPRTLAQAGNGFLMRRGYTVAWLAWQGDLLPGNGRLLLDLPVARERHGPVTGLVRTEYIADRSSIIVFPLSGRVSVRSHPTVSLDPREARLTRRPTTNGKPYPRRAGVLRESKAVPVSTTKAPSRRWSPPTATSTFPAGLNRAGSTNWSTPPATRWCSDWAMSWCGILSAFCDTARRMPPVA